MPFRDPRSWGVFAGAGVYASRGLIYWPNQDPARQFPVGLADVASFLPIGVYGTLWLAGAVGLAGVAAFKLPVHPWMTLLMAPPTIWGVLYFWGGVTERVVDGIGGAMLFGFFTVMLGSLILEPPRQLRVVLGAPL